MPRPNPARTLASEQSLATRIAYERGERGMSYAGLAKRMTAVGCAIDQSAIYKIEKGEPRRRVTVDELVALSKVFDLDIGELLVPPETILSRRLTAMLAEVVVGLESLADYDAGLNAAWRELREQVQRPEALAYVEERFQRIEREDVRRTALKALHQRSGTAAFKVTLSVQKTPKGAG